MKLDEKYREWMDWPGCATSVDCIDNLSSLVHFYREKNSHAGLSKLQNITHLLAKQVNQGFLEEITKLENLEYLEMETVTAEDIRQLKNLTKLRYLKISGIRKISDFTALLEIVGLRKLFIENAKQLKSVDFLANAHNLVVLGVEGGMYTKQQIFSLQPLSKLAKLEALYLSSVQLEDKNLDCLSGNPKLEYLSSARFAPKSSFVSLRKQMPNLICKWCDHYEV